MAKGKRVAGCQFDQTYLDTDSSHEVHRDYAAHYFRWGFAFRHCPGKKVLDAGCGPNFTLGKVTIDHGRMQMRPLHYVGVDLSSLPPVRTKHKTIVGDFDFSNRSAELVAHFGKFDVVTSFEVVEHMPKEDGLRFLAAMAACLKPDGVLMVSTPKNEGWKQAKNHVHEWSGSELEAALTSCGLTVARRFGTYADVKDLERAARERMPAALETMMALSDYYSNDVLSTFLAPLFPEESKNCLWFCRHRDPGAVDPGPSETPWPGRSWPVPEVIETTETTTSPEDASGDDQAAADDGEPTAETPVVPAGLPDDDEAVLDGVAVEEVPWADRKADRPGVLAINSYAGSLLLGSEMAGTRVSAVMEDCGFGAEWQAANFPYVQRFSQRKDWPAWDLSAGVVIAHPPCAAFSVQAIGTRKKHGVVHGLENGAFKETVDVMEYAMSRGALMLAVESVQGALEGAREVHDQVAAKYGYHVYRLLQNAATFGVPQWRPRFWAVFTKRAPFRAWHRPVVRTVGDVLDALDPGPAEPDQEARLRKQREVLDQKLGAGAADRLLCTPGTLPRSIQRLYRPDVTDLMTITPPYCVGTYERVGTHNPNQRRFISACARVLDPAGFAPVIVRDSWFVYRGRNVTPEEYRALMGFPRDYQLDAKFRMWLSKGVVPAVAAWVVELMQRNVAGDFPADAVVMRPGETVDFQVDKKMALAGPGPRCRADVYPVKGGNDDDGGSSGDAGSDGGGEAIGGGEEGDRLGDRADGPRGAETHVPGDQRAAGAPGGLERSGSGDELRAGDHRAPEAVRLKSRKRRVEGRYNLTLPDVLSAEDVRSAFSQRGVLPPVVSCAVEGRLATLVCQYEPPNAGGTKTDVDRIVERAAKKLGATWRRL